jgi:plasmid stability protein
MKDLRIRNISDDLHRRFKTLCASKGVSMNDYLIQLIKEAVEKEVKKGV